MSEMVERVARTIASAQLCRQYIGTLKNIGCVIEIDKIWPEFVPEAKAAIAAMREPNEAMIEAAHKAYYSVRTFRGDSALDGGRAELMHNAMIDAALAAD